MASAPQDLSEVYLLEKRKGEIEEVNIIPNGKSQKNTAVATLHAVTRLTVARHLGDVPSRSYCRLWASAASRRGDSSGAGTRAHRKSEIGPRSSATNATRARGSARTLWRSRERQLEGN